MRSRLARVVLTGLVLTAACRPSSPDAPPSAPPPSPASAPTAEPTTLEDELALLRDESTVARGLSALERRIPSLSSDAEREAVAGAMASSFLEAWDDASSHRSRMLRLCLLLSHPSTSPVWDRALGLDGSAASYEHTLLALEGIEKAGAADSVPALVAALEQLVADPLPDQAGEHAGEVRAAMVDTLGTLGDQRAVAVLIAVLEQSVEKQPVAVHRRAADALGILADPSAVDALLAAAYRVPDVMTTTNIAERSRTALAAIGEPAVPRVVDMLEGRHEAINELAQQHGIDPSNTTMGAAMLLGTIGSPTAVDPLLEALPTDDCRGRRRRPDASTDDFQTISMRAVIANALGQIGDEEAVAPLCRCATASRDPQDMFPIAEALGRIGGPKATRCLARVIETGSYDADAVVSPEYEHEIRWEAARFGILAAGADGLPAIEAALRAKQPPAVTRETAQWEPGRALLSRCGQDSDCLLRTLADPQANWFAREVAAITLARRSPGDAALAERIAAAFSVRNPDARVTMAWLAGHMMRGARCPRCAELLADRLEQERLSRPPKEYQLSVLTARYAIAKLREPGPRPAESP